NITVTLDDSGSMARAFLPDTCGSIYNDCDTLDNRYMKSAHHNPQYYDPTVKYPAPLKDDGTEWTTSFQSAWRNGFNTGNDSDTDDLSDEYRPTAYVNLNDDNESEGYMGHYSDDVTRCNTNRNQCDVRNASGSWL